MNTGHIQAERAITCQRCHQQGIEPFTFYPTEGPNKGREHIRIRCRICLYTVSERLVVKGPTTRTLTDTFNKLL